MKIGFEILWLSEKDVTDLFKMDEAFDVIENAFRLYGQGEVQMPPKMYLDFESFNGDLRAMPAYVKGSVSAAGVKIVNSHAENPSKGLPAVAGVLVLNDPETGMPLALMAAGVLTGMRTGAAGGVAAKYLSRKNSQTLGLVGCGRQAGTQLEAICRARDIKKVFVWGKTIDEAQAFSKQQAHHNNLNFVPTAEVKEVCQADIIVTTTPVRSPVVKENWVAPGTHINAIGADAPGKQELETGLLKKSDVYVDQVEQASHAGEINVPLSSGKFKTQDIKAELGDVVAGKKMGRNNDNVITVFDSTGLALQDISSAKIIFEKALKFKKGILLKTNG